MTNIATLFVGFGMFGSFLLIPQLAELPESTGFGFGLGATGAGLLMLPGALVMLVRRADLGRARHPLRLQAAARDGRRDDQRRARRPRASTTAREATVVLWAFVMSTGIGLAFAAMANLIVEAVPPSPDRRGDRDQHARRARSARRSARRSAPRSSPAARSPAAPSRRDAASPPRSSSRAAVAGARRVHRGGDPARRAPGDPRPPAEAASPRCWSSDDDRHPAQARGRRPQPRARDRRGGGGVRGARDRGERARGRGPRRRRQGDRLPLLPDEGAPRRRGRQRPARRVRAARARAARRRRTRGRRCTRCCPRRRRSSAATAASPARCRRASPPTCSPRPGGGCGARSGS